MSSKNSNVPHTLHEDNPWTQAIPGHPPRKDSAIFIQARKFLNKILINKNNLYGPKPVQAHHGGALWLKDGYGWFMVKNLAGLEWCSQWCADPKKVDLLRQNAVRLYVRFPETLKEFQKAGIDTSILNKEIKTAQDIADFIDSVFNSIVPLPAPVHVGVIPRGNGVHHYPTPVVDITFIKHDDFNLFVQDEEKNLAAVVPVAPRDSGDGRVEVIYAAPGSKLGLKLGANYIRPAEGLILGADHPMALQAFKKQNYYKKLNGSENSQTGDNN